MLLDTARAKDTFLTDLNTELQRIMGSLTFSATAYRPSLTANKTTPSSLAFNTPRTITSESPVGIQKLAYLTELYNNVSRSALPVDLNKSFMAAAASGECAAATRIHSRP
ncbi:MAG: hypothetical protein P1U63_05360 [Coxiellaceae bacterium]|nr:hypothetical protein [Coxiellaceae bacterium]